MFKNRQDACLQVFEENKEELLGLDNLSTVVLGLGENGQEMAKFLAKILNCSLDVIFIEKIKSTDGKVDIGAVGQTEGSMCLNENIIKELGITKEFIDIQVMKKKEKIMEKEKKHRGEKKEIFLKDKNVIICSDGVITGLEMITAAREVWNRVPKKVIAYAPVFSLEGFERVEKEVDSVIKIIVDKELFGASQYYEDF